ncbi:MAG: pentapeptide repeat-containing protein [Pseudomonadota bacterium]|nr:pentapeptide repeat-containing protein [Pseudomonadota bacterium]
MGRTGRHCSGSARDGRDLLFRELVALGRLSPRAGRPFRSKEPARDPEFSDVCAPAAQFTRDKAHRQGQDGGRANPHSMSWAQSQGTQMQGNTRTRPLWRLTAAAFVPFVVSVFVAPAAAGCRDTVSAGVDWTDCSKQQLMLRRYNLSGAILKAARLTSTDFTESNLSHAKLMGAELSFVRFEGANLAGADLTKAMGARTSFARANLAGARLDGAEFSRSSFVQAKLAGSSFAKSEINRSTFQDADLTGADLSKAEIARVNLTRAKVSGVNFSFSNLARADLRGLDLAGADLSGAYTYLTLLAGADLSQAKGIKPEQLAIACGTAETRLPPGLAPPQTWPCAEGTD